MLEQEDCPCSPAKSFSSKLLSDDKMPVHFCVICQVSVLVLCESFDSWCTYTHIMVDLFLSDKKLQTLFTYRKMVTTPKKMKCCVFSLFMLWVHNRHLPDNKQLWLILHRERERESEKIVLVTICLRKQSWCAWMFLILICTAFGQGLMATRFTTLITFCLCMFVINVGDLVSFWYICLKRNDICN